MPVEKHQLFKGSLSLRFVHAGHLNLVETSRILSKGPFGRAHHLPRWCKTKSFRVDCIMNLVYKCGYEKPRGEDSEFISCVLSDSVNPRVSGIRLMQKQISRKMTKWDTVHILKLELEGLSRLLLSICAHPCIYYAGCWSIDSHPKAQTRDVPDPDKNSQFSLRVM